MLFTAQLHPGRALGFLILGASLHDVLTRIKAEPQRFPKLEVIFSSEQPVTAPVCVVLPHNGIRLRFDGPEQRLRLIEVVDFTKNHITFKDRDLMKPPSISNGTTATGAAGAASAAPPSPLPSPASPLPADFPPGPTFRHIYNRLLGPTYAGEFIPPSATSTATSEDGTYVLSYPGVAFNFPLAKAAYSPDKDVVSLLSAPSSQVATSMALFSGKSWADARATLWTEALPSIKQTSVVPRTKDVFPDEVSLVRIHGGGKLDLHRKWLGDAFPLRLQLGRTTPQELVMELGPPNAIYRKSKNDQKMVIHKMRTGSSSNSHRRPSAVADIRPDDLTDTDQSSMNTGSDEESGLDDAVDEQDTADPSSECFYNYFYLGFDVLLSPPAQSSEAPPGGLSRDEADDPIKSHHPDRLVATKLILHGNVPGSYEFNRHRRCRWEIAYLNGEGNGNGNGNGGEGDEAQVNSETKFQVIEDRLNQKWASAYPEGAASQRQRGMVLNRGWGDSPGSSCELLGGWEESSARRVETNGESTTTLFGFPGLVFEVLRNDYVNTVTVF